MVREPYHSWAASHPEPCLQGISQASLESMLLRHLYKGPKATGTITLWHIPVLLNFLEEHLLQQSGLRAQIPALGG